MYNRLLHDVALGLGSDAIVGYLDRFRGPMEVQLREFKSSSVPWHRVLYFRAGSEFLWHKETRFDSIFKSTDVIDTPEAVARREADVTQAQENKAEDQDRIVRPLNVRPSSFEEAFRKLTRVPVHRYSTVSEKWEILESVSVRPGSAASKYLTIATVNVLQDKYLPASMQTYTEARWRAITEEIVTQQAAIWVLAEATVAFAQFVLANPQIQAQYSSTDGPLGEFSVLPKVSGATGQLVLVRRDFDVQSVHFYKSPQVKGKQVVFVVTKFNGLAVALAAVHLTAGQIGRTGCAEAVEKRRMQLKFALQCLMMLEADNIPCDIQVVAGDFNFHPADDAVCRPFLEHFVEVDDGDATFDPGRNSLAALQSTSAPRRTDRIYARFVDEEGKSLLSVSEHRLLLEKPLELSAEELPLVEVYPSDHFGIMTIFCVGAEKHLPRKTPAWSTSTALAILPSKQSQEEIDAWMRNKHDVSHGKWPPHLNLLFPFVASDLLSSFVENFNDAVRLKSDFSTKRHVSLDKVDCFRHKGISTIYLSTLDDGEPLKQLQGVVEQVAAQLAGPPPHMSGRPTSGWTPHLTVARVRNADVDIFKLLEETRARFDDEKWSLDWNKMYVLQKFGPRMEIVETITLPFRNKMLSTQVTLEFVGALGRRIFAGDVFTLTPVGSAAYLNGTLRDVDVVLYEPKTSRMSAAQFAVAANEALEGAGSVRVVDDAICPVITISGLQATHGVLPVDVMYGQTEGAAQAIRDTNAISARLATFSPSHELFTETLSEVKKWADMKMLTGRGYTLFPGVAWTIMMLAVANNCRGEFDAMSLLEMFFESYASLDFGANTITIDGIVHRPCSAAAPCVVLMPASQDNVCRRVSRVVVHAVQAEMRMAAHSLKHAGAPNTFTWRTYARSKVTVEDIMGSYGSSVVIFVCGLNDISGFEGWLRGRLAQFLNKELGERNICVRPTASLSVSNGECSYECAVCDTLSTAPPADRRKLVAQAGAALHDRFMRWEKRTENAKLRVALRRARSMPTRQAS